MTHNSNERPEHFLHCNLQTEDFKHTNFSYCQNYLKKISLPRFQHCKHLDLQCVCVCLYALQFITIASHLASRAHFDELQIHLGQISHSTMHHYSNSKLNFQHLIRAK